MRGRFSRKLRMLAKAGCLLWLLWLGYILLANTSFPSSSSLEEEEENRAERQLSLEESSADGQLARPINIKPPPNSNAPGEWGQATHLNLSPDWKKQEQESIERYAINIFVSDKISLHRHIQDHRMNEWVQNNFLNRNEPPVRNWQKPLSFCKSYYFYSVPCSFPNICLTLKAAQSWQQC